MSQFPNLDQISAETLELAKQVFARGGTPLTKDATTTGYTYGTGLFGYELEAPAKSLYPVVTKFLNRIPRTKAPVGSQAAHWRAIVAIDVGGGSPFVQFGAPGNVIQTQEKDFTATYKVLAKGNSVQLDAQVLARGFDDLRARAGMDTLFALKIAEEIAALGAQGSQALQAPGAPTLAVSTTGGSIGAVTVYVAVAAKTLANYNYGGSTPAGAVANTGALTGSTNKVTATWQPVQGAVAYDVYVGTAPGALYFWGTVTNTQAVITSVPSSGAQAPAADSSQDPNAFDGLIPSIVLGGGIWKDNGNQPLTPNNGTVTEIDNLLLQLYGAYKLSPTALIMNQQQAFDIANKALSSGGARIMFEPGAEGREGLVAGVKLAYYMNKATGELIEVLVDPYMTPGTIVGITERLPFPNVRIPNVFEIETQQEYQQIEYAMSRGSGTTGGPRYDFEVRAIEVFKNYFPAGCFVLTNIAAG